MMCEVLEPNWAQLVKGLHAVSNIDDVLLMHNDFLDKCLRDCMLSNRDVLTTMSRLLAICVSFTRHIRMANTQGKPDNRVQRSEYGGRSRLLSDDGGGPSVKEKVLECERKFRSDLVQLLEWLYSMSSEGVGSMAARLDFNGFYKTAYSQPTH